MILDGYVRVSRVGGREGDSFVSPVQQREAIERYAAQHGHTVAEVFTDLDKSGGKMNRPEFNKAMARAEEGATNGIIVAKLDRFGRSLIDGLTALKRLDDAGREFIAVADQFDTSAPMGKAMMRIALVFAELTLDNTRESWRDSRRRAVERGVHIASKAPTGYLRGDDGKLVPHPEYSPHIAEVFRRKAAGHSWGDLALYLREHRVESPYGMTRWQPRALGHMIANRAYLGEARSGEFTNPSAHEPLVDEETWQAAQEAVGQRPVNGMGGSLLAGVLRCEGCGHVLKPDTMKDRDGSKLRLYRCRSERSSGRCPSPASTLGGVIEPYVIDTFLAEVTGMRAEGTAMADDLRDAEQTLERTELEMSTYLAAVSAADVGAEAFAAGARQRKEASDQAQVVYDEARQRAGLADLPLAADLMTDWPNLTVAERNRLLRAAFDTVMLSKGRVPIAQRTEVFWKGEAPADLPPRRSVGAAR